MFIFYTQSDILHLVEIFNLFVFYVITDTFRFKSIILLVFNLSHLFYAHFSLLFCFLLEPSCIFLKIQFLCCISLLVTHYFTILLVTSLVITICILGLLKLNISQYIDHFLDNAETESHSIYPFPTLMLLFANMLISQLFKTPQYIIIIALTINIHLDLFTYLSFSLLSIFSCIYLSLSDILKNFFY